MSNLKPVIVVTGASKGIGLAVTKILLQTFNANVAALSRTLTPELEALAGPSLLFVKTDVTDEAAVAAAMTTTEETYGSIDGLVLNAGTLYPLGHLGSDTPLSGWKEHFDVNFFALVTCIRTALPALRKSKHGGRVVFVSSGAAAKGVAGWGPYNCSKAAMNGLCRTLSFEEPDVVSVALRPGMVDTEMQNILRDNPKEVMKQSDHNIFVSAHAEGRLVKPEDCGHVIAALALKCPKSLSGEFCEWNSDTAAPFRRGAA